MFDELSQLIEQSQTRLQSYTNGTLTMLFWQAGKRINEEILQHKRAEYAKQIVPTLSKQLSDKYGRNFEEKNLRRMLQFAAQFTDASIAVTLSRQLKHRQKTYRGGVACNAVWPTHCQWGTKGRCMQGPHNIGLGEFLGNPDK